MGHILGAITPAAAQKLAYDSARETVPLDRKRRFPQYIWNLPAWVETYCRFALYSVARPLFAC